MGTDTQQELLPPKTSLSKTALTCTDMERLVEFYRDVIGFKIISETGTTTELGVGGTPILVLSEDKSKRSRKEAETGLYHNAFRVPSRAALGASLRRIESEWELTGASDHRVSEAIYLRDPEGNGIEVYRDFPRDTWPVLGNGRIDIGTEPLDLTKIRSVADGNDALPEGTDLGHIHLEVSSINETRAFYGGTIGFDVMMEVPQAIFMAAGGYHHHIGANTWQHRSRSLQGQGLRWFEITIPDETAYEEVHARITKENLSVEAVDDGIEVMDPDGIPVRIRPT